MSTYHANHTCMEPCVFFMLHRKQYMMLYEINFRVFLEPVFGESVKFIDNNHVQKSIRLR